LLKTEEPDLDIGDDGNLNGAHSFVCAVHPDGQAMPTLVTFYSAQPCPDEDKDTLNTLVKIISTYVDMDKSRSASKAKSSFLSRVSHEIRTPMNAIIGLTGKAKSATAGGDTDVAYDSLTKINLSAKYLMRLINEVLEMSRIESGKALVIENAPFSLSTLLSDVDAIIRYSMETGGLSFTVHQNYATDRVIGDMGRINQVLMNLLGNANKFTERGGSVVLVVTEKISGEYEFCVRDTGIGIAYGHQENIFHAFEQADAPGGAQQRGTGLGLSISRNIIRAMGSDIVLTSEPGMGSEFKFTLSLEPHKGELVSASTTEDFAGRFTGKRALIVDDVDVNIEILEFILHDAGFETEAAANGREAVDKFQSSPVGHFDIILMDVQMPVIDGITAAEKIRSLANKEDARTVPIIALTANAFDEDWKKSADSGMNDHISKPVNTVELLSALANYVLKEKSE
jgi:CheY-like chemotaxis protein/nitrogen-specific signal transduction histidine kinase